MHEHRENGRTRLEGVIFDLDGVVIDSHPVHKKAWKTLLKVAGKDVEDSELEYVVEGQRREEILRHFLPDLSEADLYRYGKMKETLFRELASEVGFIPGFLGFLQQIEHHGCPVAIASSAAHSRVVFILRRLQILDRFRTVITADDVRNGKPDPEVFRNAAAGMRVPCQNVLVVEDAVHGVRAAKTAGMKCMGIASSPQRIPTLREAGADLVTFNYDTVGFHHISELYSGH